MVRAITFTIESDLRNVALVARAMRGVCGLVPLGAEALDELELGLVEAVNNVVEHGLGDGSGLPIMVAVELHEDRVALRITDRGKRIPADLLEGARGAVFVTDPDDLDGLPESGMGLRLIMSCADAVSYSVEDGANHLLLEKLIPASS
jgi:serine/threonine-protein kinase RsbW